MKEIESGVKEILNNIGDGILFLDRDYKVIFANKTVVQLCGQKEEDVIGRECHNLFHQSPIPCHKKDTPIICPHHEVFRTGKTMSITHTHVLPDGTEKIFDIITSPITNEKGDVIQVLEILRDVTEKRRVEEALKESEIFLSSILEGIQDGVVVLDRDFRILFANNSYIGRMENSSNEIKGKHCYGVLYNRKEPCYSAGLKCSVKNVFKTGLSSREIRKKDGKHIEVMAYPLKDSSGKVISVVEIRRDVTKNVQLDEEVKNRIKELESFYDMAVGRELKMVELKEDIKRLKEELTKRK